jgi:CHAT domain-containing protein/Tfp pilus assembly protein PilF
VEQARKAAGLFITGWMALSCWAPPAGGETQGAKYLLYRKNGDALRQAGDFQNAIPSFESALALARAQKDLRPGLDCLINLGILHWNIGQMNESAACHAEALSLARRTESTSQVTVCSKMLLIHSLYGRGKKALSGRRYQQSIRQFEAAISLARELGRPEFELKCLRQLSLNYFDLEKMNEFLELNNRALGIARVLKHRSEEAKCLNNIGLYFFKANRYSKALTLYEDALMILRETPYNEEDKADCLNNIALIHLSLGSYDKALRYQQEAVAVDQKLNNDPGAYIGLNNIGEIMRYRARDAGTLDKYSEAIDYFSRALKESRKAKDKLIEICSLNNIGLTYTSLAEYSTALSYFRSALEEATSAGRGGDIGAIACNIGQAYLQMGNSAEAKSYFMKSIELAARLNRDEILWETYLGLGQCLEVENESMSALKCYEKAADIIDTIRQRLSWDDQKTGFARDKWKVYDAWVELLCKKKRTEPSATVDREIWEVVERAKARALSDGLSQAEAPSRRSLDPRSLSARKHLTRKMSLTISRLAQRGLSSESRKDLLESLERDEDEYAILMNRIGIDNAAGSTALPGSIISLQDVQRNLLDANTAIVEFFLGEKLSLVILITDEQVAVEALPPRSIIEDSLKAYLKILSTPPNKKFLGLKAGRRIYEELFASLDGRLGPRRQNLIIIPDGVLCYLPFEALVRGGSRSETGNFLVESFQVSYAPSVSTLALLRRRQPAGGVSGRILAMGNPVYTLGNSPGVSRQKTHGDVLREIYQDNGFDFSPLPYSQREILQIAAVFPDHTVDTYLGLEAREEVVKTSPLADYQIIHFACHGFLDEKSPQRSALVLSLDDDLEEDGFLQAREIYELQLNADLVVLSACQTGRGRLENGEGILGLPRMFFYAGARSTISSLWKISDSSTSSLMQDFYRRLAAGAGKVRALREAKLCMLRSKFAHPFYWAGFILHGDYRSPQIAAAVSR